MGSIDERKPNDAGANITPEDPIELESENLRMVLLQRKTEGCPRKQHVD